MTETPPSDNPSVEWFVGGIIEPSKLEGYLLSPTHPKGMHKARLWRSFFDIGEGDGEKLDSLIREHLVQAEPEEQDPKKGIRRWRLDIPEFRGPNGNVAPVFTSWAYDPRNDRPHLTTAYPLPER